MLVEIPAALLVVAEIVILFAGVVARYVLQQPLIWSDELASILFLWLAMLGAVVAFRRAEHMRMTAVVGAAPSPRCARLSRRGRDLRRAGVPAADRRGRAYQYAYEESFITTPALQISNSWRAAALPVGICLMALFALLRLARVGDIRLVLAAVLSVALLMAAFLAGAAVAAAARQSQSHHLLCRRGRLLRVCRRADRVRRSAWRFSAIWR